MARFKKSFEELRSELLEQIEELRDASKSYDRGTHRKVKNLATTIYNLLHDGRQSIKSLLGQLQIKENMKFLTSAPTERTDMAGKIVGIKIKSGDDPTFTPLFGSFRLEGRYRWIEFDEWWGEVVFETDEGLILSRRDIIRTLRDQDGAAHIDDHIRNESYYTFKTDGDPSFRFYQGVEEIDPASGKILFQKGTAAKNGIKATTRQIAWELDQSLIKIAF